MPTSKRPKPTKSAAPARKDGTTRTAAGLTEASIIEAARVLVRRVGVDDMNMRSLARELGVSPMAVYHHIADKDALLHKVRESIVARIKTDVPARTDWEAQVRAYVTTGIMSLAEYPGLLSYGALRPPTPSELRLTLHGVAVLLAAGFEPAMAASAITSLHCALFGLVVAYRQVKLGTIPRSERASAQGSDGLTEALDHMGKLDFRKAVDFTIDTIMKGLRAQLADAKKQKAQRRRKPA